jgi:hypothetical protein
MKLVLTILLLMVMTVLKAQSPAEKLAGWIAQKMTDTLSLTAAQKNQIYTINMQLHNQKMAARQQHPQPDSMRIYIQKIENSRDALYHGVLADDKYTLYLQKKTRLVTNN